MTVPAHSLTALLAHRLARAPDSTAWLLAEGAAPAGMGPRLSTAQFAALVQHSAAWLAGQGVGAGDRVALWLVNRIEWLALALGAARVGAAVLSVNTRYRSAEVADLLQRARPRLLVLQPRFRGVDFLALLAELPAGCADSLTAVVLVDAPPAAARDAAAADPVCAATQRLGRPGLRLDMGPWLASGGPPLDVHAAAAPSHAPAPGPVSEAAPETGPGPACEPEPDHADAPFILFSTSGTTSGPKLVQHTQRTVALHLHAIAQGTGLLASDAVLLAALPLAGTFGFVSALAAWAAGRPVLLHPTWDAATAAADVQRHAVTHLFGSDEMFEGLLQHAPASAPATVPVLAPTTAPVPVPATAPVAPDGAAPALAARTAAFPSLRLCGFAAFRAGALQVAEQALARGLPMAGLYGSSEVHALFAIQPLQQPLGERLAGGGRPLNPDAQVRVRDAQTGALLPPGQAGLLEIRSPSNFIGYLGNPQATANALDAEGWFSTGDIGHLRPDGSFVYTTRAGDAVRLGGYLVAPAEIEAAIQAVPGVAGAQVVAVDIGGKSRAVAFVVLADVAPAGAPSGELGAQASADLARQMRQLAAYKVPARVWVLPAFPVVHSANGTKVQRHRLREMALQRLAEEGPMGG